MVIGLVPNISKNSILEIITNLSEKLIENNLQFIIDDSILEMKGKLNDQLKKAEVLSLAKLAEASDILISIGGDGTMLNTAYEARNSETPILGLNLGKLGFLAEFDIHHIDELIKDLKDENFSIEERMTLEAKCSDNSHGDLFAINDIVVDRGKWPKMIELTLKVDDDYVSTFSADGLIIATPTGTTGYSLSTGGPIVNPKAHVITISPISPHTLTMRPLVLSSDQKIHITAASQYTGVQINCDGQRVHNFKSPASIEVYKSKKNLRLVHTKTTNYFEILRNKLLWGLDVRKNHDKY